MSSRHELIEMITCPDVYDRRIDNIAELQLVRHASFLRGAAIRSPSCVAAPRRPASAKSRHSR